MAQLRGLPRNTAAQARVSRNLAHLSTRVDRGVSGDSRQLNEIVDVAIAALDDVGTWERDGIMCWRCREGT